MMLAQGGYAPTPPSATLDDQLYMVRISALAVCVGMPEEACEGWLRNYERIEGQFLSEMMTSEPALSYVEWLRDA